MAGEAFVPSGHVVMDIEIARSVESVGGWDRTDLMGVSCAVVYDVNQDRYRVFDSSELEDLHDCLDRCDRITTWGGWGFDFPVIYGCTGRNWKSSPFPARPGGRGGKPLSERSNDLLRGVWTAQGLDPDGGTADHGGWKLEQVGEALLGVGKCGDGALAPELFAQGRWGELITYCQQDVWLTASIDRFIRKHGFVINKGGKVVRFGRKAS